MMGDYRKNRYDGYARLNYNLQENATRGYSESYTNQRIAISGNSKY
jgi:hypothetical protein